MQYFLLTQKLSYEESIKKKVKLLKYITDITEFMDIAVMYKYLIAMRVKISPLTTYGYVKELKIKRYFNTLKNELLYLCDYDTEEELYKAIDDFAYVHYNHKRPHTFNGYKTPFQKRYGD